jgi:hypothetical protein
MTDEQFKNLPEVFREIIEVDRAIKALRPAGKVVPITYTPPPNLVRLRQLREALRIGAKGYGKKLN